MIYRLTQMTRKCIVTPSLHQSLGRSWRIQQTEKNINQLERLYFLEFDITLSHVLRSNTLKRRASFLEFGSTLCHQTVIGYPRELRNLKMKCIFSTPKPNPSERKFSIWVEFFFFSSFFMVFFQAPLREHDTEPKGPKSSLSLSFCAFLSAKSTLF